MSYRGYVIAAYCVFAVVMLWDFVAPRLAIRQQARAARLRAMRSSNAGAQHPGTRAPADAPLSRD
ncbi:MAG: heme exporter protein CcmD [Luteimonas sp.]